MRKPRTAARLRLLSIAAARGHGSLIELARACGISNNTMCDLANGKRIPTAQTVRRLADELKVSEDTLGEIIREVRRGR